MANSAGSTDTPTQDLRNFPDFTFAEVESRAKTISGCRSTTKAYKFFAEPGYLHDIQGTADQTRRLIAFWAENHRGFSKKKYASKVLWERAVKDLGLEGRVTSNQASKKWENLKMKYRNLRTPRTGSGTTEGEETASSWAYFEEMHAVLGGTPALDPPVLVASKPLGNPVPLLLSIIDPDAPAPGPDPPCSTSAPFPTSTSSATPSPPQKRAKKTDSLLEFFKEEALKEERRHEQAEAKTDRFLTLFEKLIEKL